MSDAMWPGRFEDTLRPYLPLLDERDELTAEMVLPDLGLDSLGTVGLLVELESAFGVQIPDDALTAETFATPGSLWTTVARCLVG